MAVSNDDVMRRRFALADMGKFPTSPKNMGLARRGSDPEPPPPATINPNDPASGGVVRTRNGQRSYGYLPIGQRAPYEGTWPPFTRSSPPPAPSQGNSTWGRANANPAPGAGFGDLRAREAMRGADTMQIATSNGQPPAPSPADGLVHNPNDPARYANLNANPAPGGGFGDLREREAMRGADRPEPVATGSAAPAAAGDLSQRVGDERRALMSDYERVMRELVDLGSRGRDNPETATRREVLINARKAMESRLRDLAMATPRTNVVSPEDAKVARERLARTSGVDTRTPMERGITSIANRTMPGAGSVLGEATAMSADKMAFNERQMARDARQAEGARRLTTALPGGEAPLAMMERERAEMQKRRADQVALEQATAERAIRDQKEGDPARQKLLAEVNLLASQGRFADAQAKLAEAQANRTINDINNPNSVTNKTDDARRAVAAREAARAITGVDENSITQAIDTIGLPDNPDAISAWDTNVVSAIESLANAGMTAEAAKLASMALPRVAAPARTTQMKEGIIRWIGQATRTGPVLPAIKSAIMDATGGSHLHAQRLNLENRLRAIMGSGTATR